MLQNTYLKEISPILLLQKCIGGLPLVEEFDAAENRYQVRIKWVSWSTLYAALVSLLQGSLVICMFYKAVQCFDAVDPSKRIHAFMLMFLIFAPFKVPILVALQQPRINQVFQQWFYFEQNLRSVVTPESRFDFGISRWTKLSMVYTIVLGTGTVLLFPLLVGKAPGWVDLLLALGAFYGSMLYCVFYSYSRAVCNASAKITRQFQQLLISCGPKWHKASTSIDSEILYFRNLWFELVKVMKATGQSIYLSIGSMIVMNFIMALYEGYMLFTTLWELTAATIIFFVLCSALFWMGIIVICSSSHMMNQSIKQDLATCLKVAKKLNAEKSTLFLINAFLAQMIQNASEVSFDGYFTVGNGLLLTLVAAYITNLIVLIQFQISKATIYGLEDILEIRDILF